MCALVSCCQPQDITSKSLQKRACQQKRKVDAKTKNTWIWPYLFQEILSKNQNFYKELFQKIRNCSNFNAKNSPTAPSNFWNKNICEPTSNLQRKQRGFAPKFCSSNNLCSQATTNWLASSPTRVVQWGVSGRGMSDGRKEPGEMMLSVVLHVQDFFGHFGKSIGNIKMST